MKNNSNSNYNKDNFKYRVSKSMNNIIINNIDSISFMQQILLSMLKQFQNIKEDLTKENKKHLTIMNLLHLEIHQNYQI